MTSLVSQSVARLKQRVFVRVADDSDELNRRTCARVHATRSRGIAVRIDLAGIGATCSRPLVHALAAIFEAWPRRHDASCRFSRRTTAAFSICLRPAGGVLVGGAIISRRGRRFGRFALRTVAATARLEPGTVDAVLAKPSILFAAFSSGCPRGSCAKCRSNVYIPGLIEARRSPSLRDSRNTPRASVPLHDEGAHPVEIDILPSTANPTPERRLSSRQRF